MLNRDKFSTENLSLFFFQYSPKKIAYKNAAYFLSIKYFLKRIFHLILHQTSRFSFQVLSASGGCGLSTTIGANFRGLSLYLAFLGDLEKERDWLKEVVMKWIRLHTYYHDRAKPILVYYALSGLRFYGFDTYLNHLPTHF